MDRDPSVFVAPSLHKPMHAVVGTVISAPTKFLEQALGRAALPLRQLGFLLDDLRQNLDPVAKLRRGLNSPRVLELSLVAADDFAHRRARYRQGAHDLLDRAVLLKIGASYLADQVHANHPPSPSRPGRPKERMLTEDVREGRSWTRYRPSGGQYCARICILRLARISSHEQHAAMAEPDVCHLHGHRRAVQQNDLVAPVELVGFTWREAQRHIGRSRRGAALLAPPSGVAPHGVVPPGITAATQFLEQADQRQALPR